MMDETPADFLGRLGTDAAKWAAEFRQTAIRLGYGDMDEGWLIGWFANAIEHARAVDRWAREAAEAAAWQPIETAPRDAGSEVLLNVPPFAPMQGVRRSDGSWMVGARSIIGTALRAGMEPTHWCPLPAPPEETPDAG